MAQEIETNKLSDHPSNNPLTKIDTFFDRLERIVERTQHLVAKAKPLVYDLALFVFLILSLISYGLYLWSKWYWGP